MIIHVNNIIVVILFSFYCWILGRRTWLFTPNTYLFPQNLLSSIWRTVTPKGVTGFLARSSAHIPLKVLYTSRTLRWLAPNSCKAVVFLTSKLQNTIKANRLPMPILLNNWKKESSLMDVLFLRVPHLLLWKKLFINKLANL